MKKYVLRTVRVLIVEDEIIQLEALKNDLELIEKKQRRVWGINSFQSELAGSVKEAEDLLEAADSPFDILTLDLSLPYRTGGKQSPDGGQKLLEKIKKDNAKEVIIISVFGDYMNVINTIRKGAVDFITKPYSRERLQARVMEAWKRVLEKDSEHLLQERIKELAHYNERGLAHRHNVGLSHLADNLHYEASKLEEHIYNRYGLDKKRDSQDYLIKSLGRFEDLVHAAQQEWLKWRVLFLPTPPEKDVPMAKNVNPILYQLERDLLPCLIVKNVKFKFLPRSNPRIITFQKDMEAVLKEILSGLLAGLPDYETAQNDQPSNDNRKKPYKQITIEIDADNKYAKVKIIDNLTNIPAADAQQINAGSFTVSDTRFSRAWGLAVMQHIATMGGGRLLVEPQAGQGNIITYLIPLAEW